jgi:preprotein translocase subunit SecY
MRNRLLAVAGMLLAYRLMTHVPIPFAEPSTLKSSLDTIFASKESTQGFGFVDLLSGGALANLAIMVVGMTPYINASIIMQLLTKALPRLEELNKDGEYGRKKINQFTRLLTFPLAIVQSIGAIFIVRQYANSAAGLGDLFTNAPLSRWVLMVATLTGAAMMLMWIGELITEKGIGNGISLIITVGIVSRLPSITNTLFKSIVSNTEPFSIFGLFDININSYALRISLIMTAVALFTTWVVVKLNEASRKVTIHYAKRIQGNQVYGGVTTILPIKLISAGVVPIIFASSFLALPFFVGRLIANSTNEGLKTLGNNLLSWFQQPDATFASKLGFGQDSYGIDNVFDWHALIYPVVFFVLIVLFTYFYTSVTFNAKEIAESLQKQGGFIDGVKPGGETESMLKTMVGRLTLFGALAIGLLALMPTIGQIFIRNNSITLGGTAVLILVSVSLETMRQIESRALMVTYDQYNPDDYFGKTTGKKKRFGKLKPSLAKEA